MVDTNVALLEAYHDDTPWVVLGRLLQKFIDKIKKLYNLFFRKLLVYANKMRVDYYRKYEHILNPLSYKYVEVHNYTDRGVSIEECTVNAKKILENIKYVIDECIADENDHITVQEMCTKVLIKADHKCTETMSPFQNTKVVLLTNDGDKKVPLTPTMWRDLSDNNAKKIMRACEKDIVAAQEFALNILKRKRKETKNDSDRNHANKVIRIITTGINTTYRLTDEIFHTIMVAIHYQFESFKKALKVSIKYAKTAKII